VASAASRLTGKNGRRNRTAREQALIAAASKLFASRGFEATTTKQIAAAAGCAEGLIHRYFNGKAGLLMAIIQARVTKEVAEISENLRVNPTLAEEIRQLVNFEVDHMWEDREFLRVIIPRALVDASFGELVAKTGPLQRAKVIAERLKKFKSAARLPKHELEALANFVGVTGFMFGFMRPVVLGHDRHAAREMAEALASIVARGV
jgi:AcrR family transcriptional regulator